MKKTASEVDTQKDEKKMWKSKAGLGLDLVPTPEHRVDLGEVVSSVPEVVERSDGGVRDSVVGLLSDLSGPEGGEGEGRKGSVASRLDRGEVLRTSGGWTVD